MKKQYGFHVNVSKCTGCKTCQVACKSFKDTPASVSFRRVYEYAGGTWQDNGDNTWQQNVFAYYVSISCNHCENPICVRSCPTTAMHKSEDNLISVDHDKCIGCRYCEWACPYGSPQFNPVIRQMTKCDGCIDRVRHNKKPLCVMSCPLRALDFGPIETLRAKYGKVAAIAPLPHGSLSDPNLVITGNAQTRPVNSKDGAVLNRKEV
jgi:anaerobic dimethyl sulfoxide reductase subunit B (iron-sulfur subunit)